MRPMNGKAKRVEYLVAKFINERRADRGKDRLDTDRALTAAAREHSRDMARRGYVDHVSKRHGPPSRRVEKYDRVSENITKQLGWNRPPGEIAADIVEGWMRSSQHRKNALRDVNVRQGVGVWVAHGDVYATQILVHKRDRNLRTELVGSGRLEKTVSGWIKKVVP